MKNAPNNPDNEKEKEEVKIPPTEDIYSMFRPEHEEHPENIFKKSPDDEDYIHGLPKDTELPNSEAGQRDNPKILNIIPAAGVAYFLFLTKIS